jgi:hypothetical protein
MTRSNVKTEYQTVTSTASELIWIKQLLADNDIKIQSPMKIFCDNQITRHTASNPVFHERTKHIEIDSLRMRKNTCKEN